jgi:hypothetical protein
MSEDLLRQLRSMSRTDQQAAWARLTPAQQASVMAAKGGQPTTTAADAARRGAWQGLTFGLSEEVGSLSRVLPGGETPQEYRDRKRAEMDQMMAENPAAYLGGEVAGAVAGSAIPGAGWLSGPARAARASSLAARVAASAVRGGIVGGVDAGLQAGGRSQGNIAERVPDALAAVPSGVIGGGIAGPAVDAVSPYISKVAQKMGRTVADAVKKNLRDIASSSGLSPDEVLARIAAGVPLAGVTDTTRAAARAVKNINPAAGEGMVRQTREMLGGGMDAAIRDVQTSVAGRGVANADNPYRKVTEQIDDEIARTGADLRAAREAAGSVTSQDTLEAMITIGQRSPAVVKNINELMRLRGQQPLFEVGQDGVATLTRMPSIMEAEMLQREVSNWADQAFTAGGLVTGQQGEALRDLSRGLRGSVDLEAPQLPPLREAYSGAAAARDKGYPLGTKAGSTPPGEFVTEFSALPPPAQDAARSGAAVVIGDSVGRKARNTTQLRTLGDEGSHLSQNLGAMGADINRSPTGPLGVARSQDDLLTTMTGNSTTAAQLEAAQRLRGDAGSGGNLFNLVDNVASATPLRLITGTLRGVLGSDSGLDDAGMAALADLLMRTGPTGADEVGKILKEWGVKVAVKEAASLARAVRAATGVMAGSDASEAVGQSARDVGMDLLDRMITREK